jgi:hypothetical protein
VHNDERWFPALNSGDSINMRNMIRTALIVGTLATPMVVMAGEPKKDEAAKTEEKKTDAKEAPKADAKADAKKKTDAKKTDAKEAPKADAKAPESK